MVNRILAYILFCVALTFAAEPSVRPEVAVPIPATEDAEISKNSRDFSMSESEDWKKMRAERKAAREQILSDLRKKRDSEKNLKRVEPEKNRDKKPRFEEDFPENSARGKGPNRDMRGPEMKEKRPGK